MMSKKHFIALADMVRSSPKEFSKAQLKVLCEFCKAQNPNFKQERWLAYIRGECGPSGGILKLTPPSRMS